MTPHNIAEQGGIKYYLPLLMVLVIPVAHGLILQIMDEKTLAEVTVA